MQKRVKAIILCLLLLALCRVSAGPHVRSMQSESAPRKLLRHHHSFTVRYGTPEYGFGGALLNKSDLTFLLYKTLMGRPEEIKMERDGDFWKATFTLSDTSVKMILFAFQASDSPTPEARAQTDDNEGQFWDLLVVDETGKPVRGAHEAKALSHTGYGGKRPENVDRALEEIRKELSLYPDNYTAKTQHYTILLRKSENASRIRSEIAEDIEATLQQHPDDEEAVLFAVSAYRMIGETEQAARLENLLIQKNPQGEQAAQKAFSQIIQIEDAEVRMEKLGAFLSEFSNSRMTEFALAQYATAAIELNDTTRMISVGDKLLQNSSTPAAASGLAGIATAFSEGAVELPRAEAYARKALDLILATRSSPPPSQIVPADWEEQLKATEARYRDILGWVLFQQGQMENALAELIKAEEDISQPDIYYHLAQTYHESGNVDQALLNYARTIAFGGELGDWAYDSFVQLWEMNQRDPETIDAYLNEQQDWIDDLYQTKILAKRAVRTAPDFELEESDGGWVSLSDQKGSVTLLCFWASWSESSRMLLDELKHLSDEYGSDVLFLTVSVDRSIDALDSFVRKHRIPFPVLLNDETDKAYDLMGVPTLFVIDAEGTIHFEHRGHRPDIQKVLSIELEDLL